MLLFCSSIACAAQPITPFLTFNRSPFPLLHGAPPVDDAQLLAAGEAQVHALLDVSSHYLHKRNGREQLYIDMETYHSLLMLRVAPIAAVEFGLDLPYTQYTRGRMDDVIDQWHGLFAFPDGGRSAAPKYQFHYFYRADGNTELNIGHSFSGPNDIRLTAGLRLMDGAMAPYRKLALRGSVKLASADTQRWLGSGGEDIALSLHWREQYRVWAWFGSAGAMHLGQAELLPSIQQEVVVFGRAGLGWQAWPHVALKTQVETNSPYYRGHILQLGEPAVQLVFGAGFHFSPQWDMDVGMVEDILVNSAPDVTFHFRLGRKF